MNAKKMTTVMHAQMFSQVTLSAVPEIIRGKANETMKMNFHKISNNNKGNILTGLKMPITDSNPSAANML